MVPGGASGTPSITVPNVLEGAVLKVTVEFEVDTGTDGGFYYGMTSAQIPDAMSPAQRAVAGVEGWQNVSMSSFWRHSPGNGTAEDVTFKLDITTGGYSKHGKIGQFLMFAELVSFD